MLSRIITAIVVVLIVAGLGLLIYSKIPNTHTGGNFKTYALFHDGSRLQTGSRVIIAGSQVEMAARTLPMSGGPRVATVRSSTTSAISSASWSADDSHGHQSGPPPAHETNTPPAPVVRCP